MEGKSDILVIDPKASKDPSPPNSPQGFSQEAEWDYTRDIRRRVWGVEFTEEPSPDVRFEKVANYQGRRVIGRDTPIDGGVYIAAVGHGEALVVDSGKYPILEQEYQRFLADLQRLSGQTGKPINNLALDQSLRRVQELMPYSVQRVDDLLTRLQIPIQTNQPVKVDLSAFVQNRVGVCRHQALLTALFLEKMGKDGYLKGKASVDRNWVPGQGGHAWVRYTNRSGDIFIIDPAQNYIGSLSEIQRGIQWFYKRPEDR